MEEKEQLKVVVVGHVDHGKSTLIGRLLYETKQLPEAKLLEIEKISQKQFKEVEFAYVLDALKEEQEQNITIDITQVPFKTRSKDYSLIDAPGHKEFIKNMVTGAANAQGAILLVSAQEGIQDQTKRHLTLLSTLGLKEILVVVNKMDLIQYDQLQFAALAKEIDQLFLRNGLHPAGIIPVSARDASNLVSSSPEMLWYGGKTVYDFLDTWPLVSEQRQILRFPVQDVYRWDNQRLIVGRVESGAISPGDKLVFFPSLKETTVKTIEKWNMPLASAGPGECIGITMADQIFVERGEVATKPEHPPYVVEELQARIFWLGKEPLLAHQRFLLMCATQESEAEMVAIRQRIDPETLMVLQENAQEVLCNEVAEVIIALKKPMAVDIFQEMPSTGRFVIQGKKGISGGGIILGALGLSSRTDTS